MNTIENIVATELSIRPEQVKTVMELMAEGSTIPFIARYRKEKTGGLDDTQLRNLGERVKYLTELGERRASIVKSIESQEKMTPELIKALNEAQTRAELEDIYLPYKPKRRTKAQIAIEAGLEPLANLLIENPSLTPETEAAKFIDAEKGVADAAAALDGAKQILVERFGENADMIGQLREKMWNNAIMISTLVPGKEEDGAKFSDYFDYREDIKKIPSHRALALFRGRNEEVLRLDLNWEDEALKAGEHHPATSIISNTFGIHNTGKPGDVWLAKAVNDAWRIRIKMRLVTDLLLRLREAAETEAIKVFSDNLKDLLLAAPAGPKAVLGLDPGFRTGVKLAVIDTTGKLVDTATIFPHVPRNQWDQSIAIIAALSARHKVDLIAIGNGTASRETEKLAGDVIKRHPELKLKKIVVSEAGASVYSASELAAKEFPDLDVSIRGAVSIARRLQDPLAELVKIEPKSIGVGQYQHDVNQTQLARSLDGVIEDCVNNVGVDINMASAALLKRVAGLNQNIAENIVQWRDENGAFKARTELKKVARLGPKAFEQAAGFLRIMNGKNPLDGSAVHPEAYDVVKKIAANSNRDVKTIIGDGMFLKSVKAADYTDDKFGIPTITDIIEELEKPGRDPRPEFKAAEFLEGVETIQDLKPGMILEGSVTNVTNFGAFVDVGVHQDGLVHISQLADKFVEDARQIVRTGDIVKVKVMEVDVARKRIGLSMKLNERPDENSQPARDQNKGKNSGKGGGKKSSKPSSGGETAFAAALKRARG